MRALKTSPRELVLFRIVSHSVALFSWPAVRDGIKDFQFNGIESQTNVDENTPERATEMNKSMAVPQFLRISLRLSTKRGQPPAFLVDFFFQIFVFISGFFGCISYYLNRIFMAFLRIIFI